MSSSDSSTKVYIGDLGSGGSKPELEKEFERYGTLKSVWVARNPPGFAFIEFEDPRDAEDSVRDMDGRTVCGVRIRVELAKSTNGRRSPGRSRGGGGGGGERGGGGGGGERRYRGNRSRSPPSRGHYRSNSPERRRSSPYGGRRSRSPPKSSPPYRRRRSPSPYRGGH